MTIPGTLDKSGLPFTPDQDGIYVSYSETGIQSVYYQGGQEGYLDGGYANIIGTNGKDTIYGQRDTNDINHFNGLDGNDILYGFGGDDYLDGGAGNDTLWGEKGADTLLGGDGNDLVYYDTSTAGVTINLATGAASGGDADGDFLTSIEDVFGSELNDVLTGDAGVNRLLGGYGNDVLNGGAGADELYGNDAGAVNPSIDRVEYATSLAGVTVNLATNINTGGDAEGDKLYGIQNLGGSALADNLTGNAGANTLWGHDGNDVLAGGLGNDSLYGEAGADTLQGGDGDDYLTGGAGADALNGGNGTDVANYAEAGAAVTLSLASGGTGGVAAGDSFTNVENVLGSAFDDAIRGDAGENVLRGLGGADRLYGGDSADTLTGDAGNDSLYGEAGSDALVGGDGDDYLTGGAGGDGLLGGNGTDIAMYDSATAAVTVNLATGGSAGDATGDTYNGVENAMGSAYADTIAGDTGANALWGMAANDVLNGGAGADALKGGLGADTFVYTAISDSTVAASGRDSINDFSHLEGDRIDLGAIDADGNAGNGDTAFTFLGSGDFTGAGHEVRLTFSGGVQIVLADVNGDRIADMAIAVTSATTLVAGDFVL